MIYITKPHDHVREMKKTAEFLIPFSPPCHPKDDDISMLRSRDIIVDGYPIVAHLMISDHGDLKAMVLTLACKQVPFLPMYVVCKIATMYLGTQYLTLLEYIKDGAKIYSWMVLLRKDEPVEHIDLSKGDKVSYNGLEFIRNKEQG